MVTRSPVIKTLAMAMLLHLAMTIPLRTILQPTPRRVARTKGLSRKAARAKAMTRHPISLASGEGDDPDEDEQRSDPKTENRIPKSRFDEVNERRKLAEKRLAELEAKEAAEAAAKQGDFDFDGKEEEYMHAVVDGDFAKAKQIRTEIRNAEKALFQSEATSGDQKTVKQIKAELKFDQAVDDLQTQFPFLNPEHKGYDADLVDEILDLHGAFVGKGYDLDVAITKATNYVVKANGLDKPAEKAEGKPDDQGGKPAVTPKPADPAANRKKAQAASAQPPSMEAGTSDRGAKPVDLGSMSEEEFDALPESKRRELRGDFV